MGGVSYVVQAEPSFDFGGKKFCTHFYTFIVVNIVF